MIIKLGRPRDEALSWDQHFMIQSALAMWETCIISSRCVLRRTKVEYEVAALCRMGMRHEVYKLTEELKRPKVSIVGVA